MCGFARKVKISPLQAMKAHGGCGCKDPHITATALGRGSVASHTLGRLYHEESRRYSFYRRLSGPQDPTGHEGVKKSTRDRTRAVQPVAQGLAAWATWPSALLVPFIYVGIFSRVFVQTKNRFLHIGRSYTSRSKASKQHTLKESEMFCSYESIHTLSKYKIYYFSKIKNMS